MVQDVGFGGPVGLRQLTQDRPEAAAALRLLGADPAEALADRPS